MRLLEQFKGLSVVPSNTEKLKGFILDLAVRGKLTHEWREKNPNVDNASVLITSIANEKKRLVDQKKIKKVKSLEQINPEEIIFKTPNSWKWERLGNVGETNVGLTYKPSHIVENGTPVLRSSNIQDGKLSLNDIVRVNTNYRQKDIISKGDLLICARNGSRRLVGKCCIIDDSSEVMVFGAFMAVYRSSINPFVKLFIQSPVFRSKLEGVETTTINQITQTNLKSTCCPIPPLEEQKAIVETVKELLNEVEQLEALTKKRIKLKEDFVVSALNKLTSSEDTSQEWNYLATHFKTFFTEKKSIKSLRETILQLAVQGKLTKKWREEYPNVEPASILLDYVKEKKQDLVAEKKIKNEKSLPDLNENEINADLPITWVWCRLGEVGYTQTGSTPPKKNPKYYGSHIPFLGPANISNKKIEYPVEGLSKEGLTAGRLIPNGSLMMVCIGGSIGKCNTNNRDVSCNQQINTLTPIFSESAYIRYSCQSPFFQSQVKSKSTGSATPIINKGKWEKLIIPLPPLEEQKVIVEKVDFLMALCDELEEQIINSETQIELLMKSCLKEALEI